MSTTEPYLQPGCACPTTHHHIATPSTCDGAADMYDEDKTCCAPGDLYGPAFDEDLIPMVDASGQIVGAEACPVHDATGGGRDDGVCRCPERLQAEIEAEERRRNRLLDLLVDSLVARDRFAAACRDWCVDEAILRRRHTEALADVAEAEIRAAMTDPAHHGDPGKVLRALVPPGIHTSYDQRGGLVTVTITARDDGLTNAMDIPRGWGVERISCGTLTGTPEDGGHWQTGVLADGQKAVGVFRTTKEPTEPEPHMTATMDDAVRAVHESLAEFRRRTDVMAERRTSIEAISRPGAGKTVALRHVEPPTAPTHVVLVDEWVDLTPTPETQARMQELLRLGRSQHLLLPQDIVADLHRDAVEAFEQNTKENR